jgi:hypothetical protein
MRYWIFSVDFGEGCEDAFGWLNAIHSLAPTQ